MANRLGLSHFPPGLDEYLAILGRPGNSIPSVLPTLGARLLSPRQALGIAPQVPAISVDELKELVKLEGLDIANPIQIAHDEGGLYQAAIVDTAQIDSVVITYSWDEPLPEHRQAWVTGSSFAEFLREQISTRLIHRSDYYSLNKLRASLPSAGPVRALWICEAEAGYLDGRQGRLSYSPKMTGLLRGLETIFGAGSIAAPSTSILGAIGAVDSLPFRDSTELRQMLNDSLQTSFVDHRQPHRSFEVRWAIGYAETSAGETPDDVLRKALFRCDRELQAMVPDQRRISYPNLILKQWLP